MSSTILFLLIMCTLSGMSWAGSRIYTVQSNSVTCDFCAYDLEQQFLQIKRVNDFEIDIDGIFYIKTDIAITLDKPFIKKVFLDNGFDFNGMVEKRE